MPPKADPKAGAKKKKEAKKKDEEEDDGPKMSPPDKDAFDASLKEVQDAIEALQVEHSELGKKISERSGGKDEYFTKRNEYKAQLNEFTAKIDALMERKGEINKGITEKKQEGADMRSQLTKMKRSIGYTNESDIDERIANIEFKLWTESITLKQEKDYLKEISDLKKNRPKVGQVHKMEASLETRDRGENLRENIGTINEEMALYRDGKRQVSAKLAELNEGRKEQLGDLPKYIEEREAFNKKIKEQMEKRNTLRDEYRQKEREFNHWKNEQRKAKQDKYHEEQNKRKVEWEQTQRTRKAEQMDVQPYVAETTLIEQTIAFCKTLIASKGPAQVEEKKETSHDNRPEGTDVLLTRADREEEFYYAPTAAKKKGKSKNKGAKDSGSKPIKHNAVTFKLFDELKINAPITTDDIPGTLEKLEEQLQSYKEKIDSWETEKEEKKKAILQGRDPDAEAAAEGGDEEKAEAKEDE